MLQQEWIFIIRIAAGNSRICFVPRLLFKRVIQFNYGQMKSWNTRMLNVQRLWSNLQVIQFKGHHTRTWSRPLLPWTETFLPWTPSSSAESTSLCLWMLLVPSLTDLTSIKRILHMGYDVSCTLSVRQNLFEDEIVLMEASDHTYCILQTRHSNTSPLPGPQLIYSNNSKHSTFPWWFECRQVTKGPKTEGQHTLYLLYSKWYKHRFHFNHRFTLIDCYDFPVREKCNHFRTNIPHITTN